MKYEDKKKRKYEVNKINNFVNLCPLPRRKMLAKCDIFYGSLKNVLSAVTSYTIAN